MAGSSYEFSRDGKCDEENRAAGVENGTKKWTYAAAGKKKCINKIWNSWTKNIWKTQQNTRASRNGGTYVRGGCPPTHRPPAFAICERISRKNASESAFRSRTRRLVRSPSFTYTSNLVEVFRKWRVCVMFDNGGLIGEVEVSGLFGRLNGIAK